MRIFDSWYRLKYRDQECFLQVVNESSRHHLHLFLLLRNKWGGFDQLSLNSDRYLLRRLPVFPFYRIRSLKILLKVSSVLSLMCRIVTHAIPKSEQRLLRAIIYVRLILTSECKRMYRLNCNGLTGKFWYLVSSSRYCQYDDLPSHRRWQQAETHWSELCLQFLSAKLQWYLATNIKTKVPALLAGQLLVWRWVGSSKLGIWLRTRLFWCTKWWLWYQNERPDDKVCAWLGRLNERINSCLLISKPPIFLHVECLIVY